MPVHIVCTYQAPGSFSAGQPVGLSFKCLEMEVSSPRALWAGCSESFLSGWLPMLLASLDGSSGTTGPLPPDGRDTAVRTHWWHTTPLSCPSTRFDPCPQSLWMPCRKHGIRLSFLPEQDDDVHSPALASSACSYCLWGMSCCPLGNFYCPWLPGISQPVKRTKRHATSASQVTLEELFCPGSVQGENRWVRTDPILTGSSRGGGLGDYLHSGDAAGRRHGSAELRWEGMARWTVPGGRLGHVSSPGVGTQECPVLWVCLGDLVMPGYSPVFPLHPCLRAPKECCKGQTGGSHILWAAMTLPWPDRIDKSQGDYSYTMGEETPKEVALGIQQLQLFHHGIINSKKQHS